VLRTARSRRLSTRARRLAGCPAVLAPAVLAFAGVFLSAALAAAAPQENAEEKESVPLPPTIFDLAYMVKDPRGLISPEADFQNRWRRIWGAAGMRYHLYPSQQTGPDNWPPHLYSGGTNYSIWRHPITGWPEF